MYVSKFQRYGGAAIVVVLAVAVGAGMLPGSIDRQTSLEEKRRLERETWCDVGDARLDRGLPGPGAPPIKFDRCTTVDLNEEATSVRAVRRFTKLLGGGIEA